MSDQLTMSNPTHSMGGAKMDIEYKEEVFPKPKKLCFTLADYFLARDTLGPQAPVGLVVALVEHCSRVVTLRVPLGPKTNKPGVQTHSARSGREYARLHRTDLGENFS